MRELLLVIVAVGFISCSKDKRLCFRDSNNNVSEVAVKEIFRGFYFDSLFVINDKTNGTILETGFYRNGFRSGKWVYIGDGTPTESIDWRLYVDNQLPLRTSSFKEADSIVHGDNYSKLKFKTKEGPVTLTVGINSTIKDSLPERNLRRVIEKEFKNIGYNIIEFNANEIQEDGRVIYIRKIKVQRKNRIRYIKSAFGYLDSDFIELSVISDNGNNFSSNKLFESVLSDLEIKGRKFSKAFNSDCL